MADTKVLERVLKALSNRRRIMIVQYLQSHKDGHVGDIADAIKLSFKATSKHLTILVSTEILDRTQVGSWMTYKLSPSMPALARKVVALL